MQYFAIFDLKSLLFCGLSSIFFWISLQLYCEIHGFQLNLGICIFVNLLLIYLYCEPNNADCVFPHFRRQWWSVFVGFIYIIYITCQFTSLMCIIFCNWYMHCVIHCFCGYLSIYWWNPWNPVNLQICLIFSRI